MLGTQTSLFWRQWIDAGGFPPRSKIVDTSKRPFYEVLSWWERRSYRQLSRSLTHYPRLWIAGRRLARDLGWRDTDWEVWKQVMVASTLMQFWDTHGYPSTTLMIGDGYGFLTALLRRSRHPGTMWSIDLPEVAALQRETFAKAHVIVTVLTPDQTDQLPAVIDCAVNIASMQEMSEENVAFYFDLLRAKSRGGSHFYCSNRFVKNLGATGIRRFHDYPWSPQDHIYFDGPCPYSTHRWLFRGKVPFPLVWHRMVRLAHAD